MRECHKKFIVSRIRLVKCSRMRRSIRFLAVGFLLISSLCWSSAEESKNVRLVFWNLEWFPGGRPEATTTEVVEQITKVVPALKDLNPDVVGYVEVLGPKAIDIALAKTPGVVSQVCSEFVDETGVVTLQQIGIASRLPAVSGWWENWKAGSITPKRGFAFAAFEPVPGHVLLVYVVHLKSNRGELSENVAMREESARQLIKHVAEMEKAYASMGKVGVIIGGDFNTSLDDPKFRDEKTLATLQQAGFEWCWKGVPFEDRVTLPSAPPKNPNFPPFPDACFDHAFTKGLTVSSASVAVIDGKPSDHRPVVVDLAYPAQ